LPENFQPQTLNFRELRKHSDNWEKPRIPVQNPIEAPKAHLLDWSAVRLWGRLNLANPVPDRLRGSMVRLGN
jgi:hypothetical protein